LRSHNHATSGFEQVEFLPSISLFKASMRHARLADNSPFVIPIQTLVICDSIPNRVPRDKRCVLAGTVISVF
jgi:hypothetical protein